MQKTTASGSAAIASQLNTVSAVSTVAANPLIPHFDASIGFGSIATGGAGGAIVHVTNLADSGTGSLRWALEDLTGKRIVVFDVQGTISLHDQIEINGDVTVAGRTSAGDGITIEGARLRVVESNVIIQGLHIRPGDGAGQNADDRDAISIGREGSVVSGVIIDGNSFSWSTDEVVATWAAPSNISITNNIIAEALEGSIHPEGDHSMGMLLGDGTRNVTVMGNLFVSNEHRNPQLIDAQGIEFINNVVYNYGDNGFQADARVTGSTAHLIGNVFIAGPDSSREPIRLNSTTGSAAYFLKDNIGAVTGSGVSRIHTTEVFTPSGVHPLASGVVLARVLAEAGAHNFAGHVDSIDARIIDDVVHNTGQIIDAPSPDKLVIHYPDLPPVLPPVLPPASPLPVHMEAEDLAPLVNMVVAANGSASDGAVLQATNPSLASAFGIAGGLADGVYDFTVDYFDESDGTSALSLEVNGRIVDSWVWNAALGSSMAAIQTLTHHTISAVEVHAGDTIRFVGQANGGEPLRVDAIDVLRTDDLAPDLPAAETIRLEVGDFFPIVNMVVAAVGSASEGTVLQATNPALQSSFGISDSLASGVYDLTVVYFDESDGASSLALQINGTVVESWVWDAQLGSTWAADQTLTSHTIHGVQIHAGDDVRFVGQANGGEPLRVDAVDVLRTADLTPTTFTVELENATQMTNMRVETNGAASDGKTLSASSALTCEVEFVFAGETEGRWNMVVDYFDENDGISKVHVDVNGTEVAVWNWDAKLGSAFANAATHTSHLIADLDLAPGDIISFSGLRGGAESLRLDAVTFVPDPVFFG